MEPFFQNVLYPLNLPARAYQMTSLNISSHWHLDVEMVYILTGSLKVGINDTSYILSEGDFFIAPSRQLHSYEGAQSDTELIIAMFNPSLIGYPEGWPKDKSLKSSVIFNSLLQCAEEKLALKLIKDNLKAIVTETSSFNDSSKYFIHAKLFEICGLCLRHFSIKPASSKTESNIKTGEIKTIFSILNYIDKNYTHKLTLAGVSEQFNLSTSYLCRLFKNSTGTNFSDYLISIRLQQVKYLLSSSEYSISDIAYECGFENLRTFNRIFKNKNDITPTEFRRISIMDR